MNLLRLADGSVDLEGMYKNADWDNLTEFEGILLTGGDWDPVRLHEEIHENPILSTLTWNAEGCTTLLQLAAHDGKYEICKLLCNLGADVNANGGFGTPLNCAAWSGNIAIVQLLLEHGAHVVGRGEHGETALHLAARKGYLNIVQVLLHAGASPNAIDDSGKTPLEVAVLWSYPDIESALRRSGTGEDPSGAGSA